MTKRCSRCRETKSLDDFGRNRSRPGGKQDYCKPCANTVSREWRERNPEKTKQVLREFRERNREAMNEKDRARYWKDPEKAIARVVEWRQANRDKCADTESRRRARINNAERIEKIDRQEIYDRDGGRCHICEKKVPRSEFQLDHLIPVADGGPHTRDNVRVAHRFCNQSRNRGRLPAQLLLVA